MSWLPSRVKEAFPHRNCCRDALSASVPSNTGSAFDPYTPVLCMFAGAYWLRPQGAHRANAFHRLTVKRFNWQHARGRYSDSLRASPARSSTVATLWAVQRRACGAAMPLAFSISAISL
jgi:hypothetical protein